MQGCKNFKISTQINAVFYQKNGKIVIIYVHFGVDFAPF